MQEQKQDLFQKIGIDISKDKINIDLKQTKDFFNLLKETFEKKAKEIQKDISEGKVDMAENVGIKIDKEHINIDLEKTKSFVEGFGRKIEGFLAELENAVDDIKKDSKKTL